MQWLAIQEAAKLIPDISLKAFNINNEIPESVINIIHLAKRYRMTL